MPGSAAPTVSTDTALPASPTTGQTATFSNAFLSGGGSIDLSSFERGNPVFAGVYELDIYINDIFSSHSEVMFKAPENEPKNAQPCFTLQQLDAFGVDTSRLDAAMDASLCLPLETRVAHGVAFYDGTQQRVMVSLPQAAMQKMARGYVDPKTWDYGMTAGLLGYSLNMFTTSGQPNAASTSTGFLGLHGGVNVGQWQRYICSVVIKI